MCMHTNIDSYSNDCLQSLINMCHTLLRILHQRLTLTGSLTTNPLPTLDELRDQHLFLGSNSMWPVTHPHYTVLPWSLADIHTVLWCGDMVHYYGHIVDRSDCSGDQNNLASRLRAKQSKHNVQFIKLLDHIFVDSEGIFFVVILFLCPPSLWILQYCAKLLSPLKCIYILVKRSQRSYLLHAFWRSFKFIFWRLASFPPIFSSGLAPDHLLSDAIRPFNHLTVIIQA